MNASFLDVNISAFSKEEVLQKTRIFFAHEKQHMIFTPNPEMMVKAVSDEYFKQVVNSSDINVCDGMGLWLALKVKSRKLKVENTIERITGVDLMLDLCRQASELGKSIYLLGSGSGNVVTRAVEVLREAFPNLKIVGSDKGPGMMEVNGQLEIDPAEQGRVLGHIQEAKPDLLFVAFGMGKQEKWIYENLAKLPSVKIAVGVGGAFDYISGKLPRAPRFMRALGLEWLFRLVRQPGRWKRILNATVKFSFLCVRELFK